jgi:flagellar capping protein FliD
MEALTKRFITMDTAVSQMQSQYSYFSSFLE